MGCGSAETAGDPPGNHDILILSGSDWWIHDDPHEAATESDIPLSKLSGPDWIHATVPGNIQADLEAAHLIGPVNYGVGDPRLDEVAKKNWWYRKDFYVPDSFAGKRLKLVFDGVDQECNIYLNGRYVGGHAGMYRQVDYDVTEAVKTGHLNRLAVLIKRIPPSLVNIVDKYELVYRYREALTDIKSPSNFGFDWAIGVYTLGIWKDVRLEASEGPAWIHYIQVKTKLSEPTEHPGHAVVTTRLEIESLKDTHVKARIHIRGHGTDITKLVDLNLKKGNSQPEINMGIDKPALWWPNGQGKQPLYELEAELIRSDGHVLHSRTARIGIRDIRWVQVEGVPPTFPDASQLVVNGRKVRLMGTNFIPADIFFGRQHEKANWLLKLVHDAGMNVVRNWGGGVTMKDDWYSLADELGILVEQEFPATSSARSWPKEYPEYVAAMERTVVSEIKQLRNHPCIFEWTGGNEMGWPGDKSPIPVMMEKKVADLDGRIFRRTDPVPGWSHGPYYAIGNDDVIYLSYYDTSGRSAVGLSAWRTGQFYRFYNEISSAQLNEYSAMRKDEFGTPGPANLEVWQREIPLSSQWPLRYDDSILIRKNVFYSWNKDMWLQPQVIDSFFGPQNNLSSMVKAGQWISANELRYAMDAMRQKGLHTSGFMNWVFNEPWPNLAGNTNVDYDGRPLMNYYFAKQALRPISLSLQYDTLFHSARKGIHARLFLVSDFPSEAGPLNWSWVARDRRGHIFGKGEGTVSIKPLEVINLGQLNPIPPKETCYGPWFIETALRDAKGKMLSERVEMFSAARGRMPFAGWFKENLKDGNDDPAAKPLARPVQKTSLVATAKPVRRDGNKEVLEILLKNTGSMTALFCEAHPLIEYRTDLFIDNNFCFIPPGASRTITIRSRPANDGLTLAETGWRISAWNAADLLVEPTPDVLLALGRRDAMTREFLKYPDTSRLRDSPNLLVAGRRPDPSQLPFLQTRAATEFQFNLNRSQSNYPATLRIHTADQSNLAETKVEIRINGKSYVQSLPRGLGIQDNDPGHLAFPATLVFKLSRDDLRIGVNSLQVSVKSEGWFTWDAMDMTSQIPK